MFRLRLWFLLALVPLVGAHSLMAVTVAVGGCKPKLISYPDISTAVGSVPPGSTIQVCPGVYPEQVTISQPLTLQGIASDGQDQVVISLPATPLTANVTSIMGQPVAAQVLVQSPGVNITNITVDGTGGDQQCATTSIGLAGIFYASGSSGEVEQVRASGQIDQQCGVGIWAENAGSPNRSVNIHDSSVHDVDLTGIFAGSGLPPTLAVTIRNNVVSAPLAMEGVFVQNVTGVIAQNIVNDAQGGILNFAAGVRASNNTVSDAFLGIVLSGGPADSNDVANSILGIYLDADGSAVESNRITLAQAIAVEFNCHSATVSHNRINDTMFGLDQVPSGFRGSNTFANTGTISVDGCAAPPLLAGAARVQSLAATPKGIPSPREWRSPANPFGARQ